MNRLERIKERVGRAAEEIAAPPDFSFIWMDTPTDTDFLSLSRTDIEDLIKVVEEVKAGFDRGDFYFFALWDALQPLLKEEEQGHYSCPNLLTQHKEME